MISRPGELALVSAPGGIPQGAVAEAAAALTAAGVRCLPTADVPAAAAALLAEPLGSVRHLRLVGHGAPGCIELGLGALHLRRHFLRAATVEALFSPPVVARLAPDATVDLLGCAVAGAWPGLLDPGEPDRFSGAALLAAVAAACPGRRVRGAAGELAVSEFPAPAVVHAPG